MKKWLLTIVILLLAGLLLACIFLPRTILFRTGITLKVNAKAFTRTIADENKWRQWWPAEGDFSITDKKQFSLLVLLRNGADTNSTEMTFIPIGADSINLVWQGETTSFTFIPGRIQNYFKSKKLTAQLNTILEHLERYYSSEDNIYSISIKKEHVSDSMLISSSLSTHGYPGVENIYGLIDLLKAHAQKNQTGITNFPMLNIMTNDSITYLTRVALPVDKKLKDEGNIVYRWMLGKGNILVTEVKGGIASINKAFAEMENYVADHNRVAPAIPFQSVVTDRRLEPDTAKWVTKVFWPVM